MIFLGIVLAVASILTGALFVAQWQEERSQRLVASLDALRPDARDRGDRGKQPAGAGKQRTPARSQAGEQPPLPWPFSRLDTLQEQAGEYTGPLRLLLTAALAAVGLGLAMWLLTAQWPLAVGGAVAGLSAPAILLRRKASHRMQVIEDQVSGLCDRLLQSLAAGTTVDLALREAARDFPAPLGDELRHVLGMVRMGTTLDVSLARLPQRLPGAPSIRMLVASLQIALEMGANLATQLERLADLLRQRRITVARVSSTVSMARLQSKILFFAPLGAYVWVHLQAPQLLSQWQTPAGEVKLLGLAGWVVFGYFITQGMLRNAFGEVL